MDLRVRLYSVASEIVSTELDSSISIVKADEEAIRHSQVC